jgi:GNAT superfamily N-acetyltransferase
MDAIARNVALRMTRATLRDLSPTVLPAGYRLRAFRPGDEPAWTAIQAEADRFSAHVIGPDLFARVFGDDQPTLASRLFFADGSGAEPIGTAAAWWREGPDDSWGRVHWLAVRPEHQGKGIGRALLTAVCARLADLGHAHAYLTTSAGRLPALRLYLSAGFLPEVGSAEEASAWEEIAHALRDDWERAELGALGA